MKRKTLKKTALLALLPLLLLGVGESSVAGFSEPSLDHRIVGFQMSAYDESSLRASGNAQSNDRDRYSKNISQFYLSLPVTEKMIVESTIVSESISGAFPIYIQPTDIRLDSAGEPINPDPLVVMSSVTEEDVRRKLSTRTTYFHDSGSVFGSAGISKEDDYRSIFAEVGGVLHFNKRANAIDFGFGGSSDNVTPLAENNPSSAASHGRESLSAYAGVSQIIDRNSTVHFGLSFTWENGFLSDPYQFVGSYSDDIFIQTPDSRPDERAQLVWNLSYRLFLPARSGALHADYRLYQDNWDVVSHTLDVSWNHSLPNNWQIIPGLRYYSQSEADFYDPYFLVSGNDGLEGSSYSSSDFRLSPYGVISLRFKVIKDIENWRITLLAENYDSDQDLGLGNVKTVNPALVDFTFFSIGVDHKF
ncbi:MAG: DUF3570 domain-containing protein [Pseudomonadales bacterium]|nr:DUF3570 domain-containing protein [Pseudomonadales bacterium]